MFGLLGSLGAGLIGKIIGTLGDTFLKPVLAHYQNKDTQFGKIMVSALEAEATIAVANADAKVRMLQTRMGAFLLFLIVAPPASYIGAVFVVTLLFDFTGYQITISSLPPGWKELGTNIVMVFIGGKGVVAAAGVAAKSWFKR